MATPRRPNRPKQVPQIPPAESDEDTVSLDDAPEDFMPDDVQVMGLLAELGGDTDAVVRIYRQGKGGYRDLTLITEMGVDEFTPILLAQPPYGGGTFRIHARSRSGITLNRLIKVEPAPSTLAPVAAGPAFDPGAFASAIALAVAAAIPKPPPAPSRADMLAEMETMARIVAPKDTGTRGPDPWELMSKAMDFTGKLRDAATPAGPIEGGATGNDLMLGVLREFGPLFKEVLARQPPGEVVASLPPAGQAQIAAPVSEQPGSAPTPSPPTSEQEDMNFRLKLGLQFLCTQAKADNDIGTYSDLVLDNVPEEELKALMNAPDWLERLAAYHKDVLNYRPWFDKLRADIIDVLNASAEDPPAGDPPAP